METTGHHTVEDQENPDHVDQNAPFLSGGSLAFLGVGYYFWEDNIDLAHWWGKYHCSNEYMICEGNISCDDNIYLDLVGNRKHQKLIQEIEKALSAEVKRFYKTDSVPLGKLIEFCKRIENQPARKGTFPFKVIRAVDSSAQATKLMRFAQGKENFIDLSPRIILCLVEKKTHLSNFRIVFPKKYVI